MTKPEMNIPIPILRGNETPRMRTLVEAERTMECYRELARAAIDWVLADRKAEEAMDRLKAAERGIEQSGASLADMGRMLEEDAASVRETNEKEERMHEQLLEQCRRLVGRLER